MHCIPKTNKVSDMLEVEKQYKVGLQVCACVQNIPRPSQTEKQQKFAYSQNLFTYLFIFV